MKKALIKQEIKNWVDKLRKHQLLKLKDYLSYFSKTELEHKPHRVIYVDVAETIIKDGKKYWKASLVENEKHLKSYDIGEFSSSVPAENCGISKVVEYLTEQNWQGRLLIYTDSLPSLTTFRNEQFFKNHYNYYLKHGKYNPQLAISKYFLLIAKKLALENNIDVKLEWVRGHENPADYYSRELTPLI